MKQTVGFFPERRMPMFTEWQREQIKRSIRIQKICSKIAVISAICSGLVTLGFVCFHLLGVFG